MPNNQDFSTQIEELLPKAWKEGIQPWRNLEGIEELFEVGLASLRGGKRTRARLAQTGFAAISGGQTTPPRGVYDLAIALEIYQASALVHDDIIDNAPLRRGKDATHISFTKNHQAGNRQGNSTEYGKMAGILLGDVLLAVADYYAFNVASTLETGYLDPATALEQILTVIRHKSGRYSVAHPLTLGARLANASDSQLKTLFAIGEYWGIAFQLCDDELGVFGNPRQTGKPAGGDLTEGKKTVLWSLARQMLSENALEKLQQVFANRAATSEQIQELTQALNEQGVRDKHRELINEYAMRGNALVENGNFNQSGREALLELGRLLVERKS